jgi:hypothetical protein
MGHLGPAALFPLGTPGNVRGVFTVGRRSGLANLADRAVQLGGELRLSAAAGGGTELQWRVPVTEEPPAAVSEGPGAAPGGKYPLV